MPADSSLNILVVDDYDTVVRIMQHLLNQAGFANVDGANSGEEALAKLREKDYGLVISDWYMEPTTGLELLKDMQQDAKLRDIPVIMVSADAMPANRTTAMAAGAKSFLPKPFDAETIRSRIVSAIAA